MSAPDRGMPPTVQAHTHAPGEKYESKAPKRGAGPRCRQCGNGPFRWHRCPATSQQWWMYDRGADDLAETLRPHTCTHFGNGNGNGHGPEPEQAPPLAQEGEGTTPQPAAGPLAVWEGTRERECPRHDLELPDAACFCTDRPKAKAPAGSLEALIAAAVAPLIPAGAVDESTVRAIVTAEIAKAGPRDETKTLRIELPQPSGEVRTIDGAHFQLPELLYWCNARDVSGFRFPVMLFGKPGTSKSYSAHQAADALGLTFGLISLNPQTPESRLFGFRDAGGTYHRTLFRDAFENGGIYLIDEIDNASDALLTSLNSALANGHGAFPDGLVKRHADFVCIATANTPGRGGDVNHAGRRPLDAATIDRFVCIEWKNDNDLEKKLVHTINPKSGASWLAWVRKVRTYCAQHHPRVIVSPRSAMMGARALVDSPFTMEQIADQTLFKGLDKDTRAKIVAACPLPEASNA